MGKNGQKVDQGLLIAIMILLVFGIIMITSIGVPKSIQLSAPNMAYPNCSNPDVDCYLLIKKHLARLAVGLVAFLIILKIDFRFWKKMALPFFIFMVMLLISVLIFGSTNNTFAKSWLVFFDSLSLQPSEFSKLALILYFSSWMSQREKHMQTFYDGFIPFVIICGLMILPVALQPDLGGTFILIAISVAIYFVAGARLRDIGLGALAAIIFATVVIGILGYQKDRILDFMRTDQTCEQGYCWQSTQAKIAVGSGGFWGRGLTQGIQKSYWLPQASDDFIFAASAEELGFLKIIAVVLLFGYIGYRGYHIALTAPNRFATLVATGVTSWIVFQAFLNIAVNISLFPITGITLPFISYGGSSLLALLIAAAILLNISKSCGNYANPSHRRRNRRSYTSQYRVNRGFSG